MGQDVALSLAGAAPRDIVVANRTSVRGEQLAERVGGRAVGLASVDDALVSSDLVLTATSSSEVLLERGQLEQAMRARGGRALLVVDIGVPRNVDPGAGEVFGVTLLDIDDLRAFGEHSLAQRRQEIGRVRAIIADELERHRLDRSAREVAPVVTALRAHADELRDVELDRHRAKLESLDPATRELVESITRGLVNKLLHEPTVRVKDAAGTARGGLYADALVELFGLPQPEPGDT
jgi:glutamyl-tRNA reductase